MRIVVQDYTIDDQCSLDCFFCDEDDQADNLMSLCFYDEATGNSMCVCPEHMDQMIVTAMNRHKEAMKIPDPFWYLTADKDPWEDDV